MLENFLLVSSLHFSSSSWRHQKRHMPLLASNRLMAISRRLFCDFLFFSRLSWSRVVSGKMEADFGDRDGYRSFFLYALLLFCLKSSPGVWILSDKWVVLSSFFFWSSISTRSLMSISHPVPAPRQQALPILFLLLMMFSCFKDDVATSKQRKSSTMGTITAGDWQRWCKRYDIPYCTSSSFAFGHHLNKRINIYSRI